MVRYREILRLTAKGLSRREVASSCGCAHSTVSDVVARCASAGIEWPLPDDMDDAAIRARIYPPRGGRPPTARRSTTSASSASSAGAE